MQNAKQITTIAILIAITSSIATYALTQNDPSILIEAENKKAIRECLSSISYESTSNQILRATEACSKLEMKKIVSPNKLNNETTVSSASGVIGVAKQIKQNDKYDEMRILHKKVCEKQINSPLCKDIWLFMNLYEITEERLPWKNWFPILLGMTNAESSLWLNFARDNVGGTCTGRNNLWGAKYKINDDNTRVYESTKFGYDYKNKKKDDFGCYLFPFDSIEDYWISKVNWMRFGYKGCIDSPTPVKCLSYAYVWDRYVSEQSWINNVSIFLK